MKALLVDGPAIAYRSHYALAKANLHTPDGKTTAATYGYTTTLLKLLRENTPDYVCVAFDTEKPTFRHELFEGYKADRPGMPQELANQLDWIREITAALGIRIVEVDGYEADDVIATLARMATDAGHDVLIATGDKDLHMLAYYKNVKIFNVNKKCQGSKGIYEKVEQPLKILADKCRLGDVSDNILVDKENDTENDIELRKFIIDLITA